MTVTLAGSLGSAVLIVGGLAVLAIMLGPRTDEGGPLRPEPRMTPARVVVIVLAALLVVGGAFLFGAVTT